MLLASSVGCNASSEKQQAHVAASSDATINNRQLPRSTPAQEGVDPTAITAMVDAFMALPKSDLHHLMIVRHGKVIAECHPTPFEKDEVHTLYSCSKTFTMLAIGMLVDDGKLKVTDKVVDLFPDKLPKRPSAALKSMTVKHLLTMGAGIKPSLTLQQESDDWARTWLAQPVTKLGKFQYDSMCTFMLASIVQRLTGKTLLEFLNERFLHPLGINEADWEMSPDNINVGGWGLRLTAESMAKAGLCMLNGGKWQGKQLVSKRWIDEAQLKHNNYSNPSKRATDTNQGYCYQMWRCLQPGAFRADGAYGQFIIMLPKQDMVVVITGVSHETGNELATIWNHLIPGVKDQPLPANAEAQKALDEKLATLALPCVESKVADSQKPYLLTLENNVRGYKTIELRPITDAGGTGREMHITCHDGTQLNYTFKCGQWAMARSTQVPPYNNGAAAVNLKTIPGIGKEFTTAGCYGMTSSNSMVLKLYWTNWIACNTFNITFNADGTATITIDEGYPGFDPMVIKATVK